MQVGAAALVICCPHIACDLSKKSILKCLLITCTIELQDMLLMHGPRLVLQRIRIQAQDA